MISFLKLKIFLKSILHHISKGEFNHVFYKISLRLPNWLFQFGVGTLYSTSSPNIPCRADPRYLYKILDFHDLTEVEGFTGVKKAYLEQRFENGDFGYKSFDTHNKNKITTIQWIHIGSCHIRGYGLTLQIEPDSAYLYGALSANDVKFKGIFNCAFRRVCEILKSRNIVKYYGLVEFWNKISRNYHIRCGFKAISNITFIKILALRISVCHDIESNNKNLKIFFKEPKNIAII